MISNWISYEVGWSWQRSVAIAHAVPTASGRKSRAVISNLVSIDYELMIYRPAPFLYFNIQLIFIYYSYKAAVKNVNRFVLADVD